MDWFSLYMCIYTNFCSILVLGEHVNAITYFGSSKTVGQKCTEEDSVGKRSLDLGSDESIEVFSPALS